MPMHIDTLDYANTLERAGIARQHAEAIAKLQAKAIEDLVTNELVTKADMKSALTDLETRLRGEIHNLGTELRGEIAKQGTDLRGELQQGLLALQAELRALKYAASIAAFALAIVVAMARLLG